MFNTIENKISLICIDNDVCCTDKNICNLKFIFQCIYLDQTALHVLSA